MDHEILCQNLSALRVNSIGWFRSYLTDREQITNINGTHSKPRGIRGGVPQGSILGLLLFLCYVNDMSNSVKCHLIQYADDSVLVVSDKDPGKIADSLGTDLKNVDQWLIENKLSLHTGKTELILFGSKRKMENIQNFSITHRNQTINAVHQVNYLGLTLDQCLSGSKIASDIVAKANARLKCLYRQSGNLNKQAKKILCTALIGCHFDYSISSWFQGIA